MERTGAMLGEGCEVIGGAVTFVLVEAIEGKFGMVIMHQAVACDFGDNRCRRNGDAGAIAAYDRLDSFASKAGNGKAVDEQSVGLNAKLIQRQPHSAVRGP